eukprot:514948_1
MAMVYTYYDYLENYYDNIYNGSDNSTYPPSWQQPFPMDIFNPIFLGIQILCAILSFCLDSMVIFRIYSNRKQEKKQTTTSLGICIPLFTLTMHSVLIIFSPFDYYTWYIQYNPNSTINIWLDKMWDLIWLFVKIPLYLVFVHRYYLVFKAEAWFNKSLRQLKYIIFGGFSITILAQVIFQIVYILFIYDIFNVDTVVTDSMEDAQQVSSISGWIFMVIDMFLVGITAYLLTRSMFKLIVYQQIMRNFRSSEDLEYTNSGPLRLVHLVTRIALTYGISIITSFIYQFVFNIYVEWYENDFTALTWFFEMWSVGLIINSLCVYLSMGIAKDHYKLLCHNICKCHQCCLKCARKRIDHLKKEIRKDTYMELHDDPTN